MRQTGRTGAEGGGEGPDPVSQEAGPREEVRSGFTSDKANIGGAGFAGNRWVNMTAMHF